jgi:hypothetical protein
LSAAARIWGILRELEQAGIIVLADKGYQGAEGPVLPPYKGRNKPESRNQANAPTPGVAVPANERTPS